MGSKFNYNIKHLVYEVLIVFFNLDLLQALVDFMSEIRGNKVTFNPNNLVLTAGATSANETLMFCLAEPGDAFLLPTPYYPGYARQPLAFYFCLQIANTIWTHVS